MHPNAKNKDKIDEKDSSLFKYIKQPIKILKIGGQCLPFCYSRMQLAGHSDQKSNEN